MKAKKHNFSKETLDREKNKEFKEVDLGKSFKKIAQAGKPIILSPNKTTKK